jgi:hypothetical protein
MSALFVNFLIDPYLKEVLKEIRHQNPKLVSYLACHECPTEEMTGIPFLDSSLLYNANSFKPTIVFSDTWLNDCKSVLMYQNNEHEFKKQILNISSHSTDKVHENVKSFLQENSNYFFESIIFHKHSRFNDNIKNCINNLTSAIINRLK